MTTPTDRDALFGLSCEALGSEFVLVAFRGREAIGQTFGFEVFGTLPIDAVPEPATLLRKPLVLTVAGGLGAGSTVPTHGLISSVEVVDETAERALLRVDVRAALWFLGLSVHSRVFTECKVGDILEEVLTGAGVTDFELDLTRSYPKRPHVSQYKESDLAFLERLMEADGIHYFFTHREDGHTLVITDGDARHAPSRRVAVAYQPVEGGDLGADLFVSIVERRALQPRRVRLTDYDPAKPSLAIEGEVAVRNETNSDVVVHGVGASDPEDAVRLARVRQEAWLAHERVFDMRGPAFHLRPGLTYEVSGHPRDAVNASYLCTVLEHVANARIRSPELGRLCGIPESLVYEARVTAVPSDVLYRPEQRRARPRIAAFERATVDGPADSEYAQLDVDGRYRIKLAYDETSRAGETASVRTRMMQPHAGSPEGFHFPLRKETEVLVGFIGGDPDRPVIAGAVPNAETPSVVTSGNPTRNIFHSGSDNRIEIEDADGRQWVDVRSPTKRSRFHAGKPHDDDSHHVVLKTDADGRFTFGGNQDVRVGGNLTEEVKGDVIETYHASQTTEVVGPQDTTVIGAVEETYQGGHETVVYGKVTENYLSGQETTVSQARLESYLAAQDTVVIGGATHTYDRQLTEVFGAASVQAYDGPRVRTVNGACTYTFDSSVDQSFGPTTYVCPSLDWTVLGSAKVFTPKWTKLYVSMNDVNANVVQSDSVQIKNFAFALQIVIALKFEANNLSVGLNGVKASFNKFAGGPYLDKITVNGLAFKKGDLTLHGAPFHKEGC
jgi:type VI secretion system secreted protein VgrG